MANREPDRSHSPRGQLPDFAALALALALFCRLALWQLDLPGLYQDEALDAAPAVRLIQGKGGWPYVLLPGTLDLPLMVSDHVGPTSTYLTIPFLWAFGIGTRAVRAYEFACGLAALALIFLWARRVVGRGGAWVAALLLAASPSLWLASRNGIHVSFILVPIAAGCLIAFDSWHRRRSPSWLYLAAFLLGVGLSTKILFLWFLLAVAVGTAVTRRDAFTRLPRRERLMGAAWFCVGAAPLLLFNVLSRGLTVRTMLASLTETPYGVRNVDFLANLRTQLASLAALLDGGWLEWAGDSPHNPVAPWLFVASALYLLARWGAPGLRRLHFCLIAVAVLLLASCFTISTLGPKHLVIMLPFSSLVVAGAVTAAWQHRRKRTSLIACALLGVLALLQFGWDLSSDLRYRHSLATTGGVGRFSVAHNQLGEYLIEHDIAEPLAGDWGFQENLEVVSAGKVRVRQIFDLGEEPPYPFTREQARQTLPDSRSVYVFHDERWTAAPGRLQAVREVAAEMGLYLCEEAVFEDGLGRPVIFVYRPTSLTPSSVSDNIVRGRTGFQPVPLHPS